MRQISRRFDRATGVRTCSAVSDCIVRTVSFGPESSTDFVPYLYAKGSCPIAEDVARRVLTLPTYYGLALEDVKTIARNVLEMV